MQITIHVYVPGEFNAKTGGSIYNYEIFTRIQQDIDVKIIEIHAKSFLSPSMDEIAKFQSQFDPTSLTFVDGLLLPLCRRLDLSKSILIYHLPLYLDTEDPTLQLQLKEVERKVLEKFFKIVVTGSTIKEDLEQEYSTVTPIIIEPGIYLTQELVSKKQIILTVGTISPRKQQLLLAEVLSRILPDSWQWICIGRTTVYPQYVGLLEEFVMENFNPDQVMLLESVDKISAYYEEAAIYCSTSQFETYGMALNEAMSFGCATVAIDGGNTKQTIGRGGIVVRSILELEDVLTKLLNNSIELKSQQQIARKVSLTRKSWEDQVLKFKEILEGL